MKATTLVGTCPQMWIQALFKRRPDNRR